jgi:hypothetical protein
MELVAATEYEFHTLAFVGWRSAAIKRTALQAFVRNIFDVLN